MNIPPFPRLRSAQQLNLKPDWRMPAHSHADFHELILVASGRIEVEIRGQRLIGTPGSVLIYPRQMTHVEQAIGGTPLVTLYLTWRAADGEEPTDWPPLIHDTTGRIQAAIRWMFELTAAPDREQQRTLDALLQSALYAFTRHERRPHDELVGRIKHFVIQHLAEPITLDQLAATAHMSKFHFTRVFRTAAGQPPMRFVRQLRVEAARTLMLTSALPLREIAPRVGLTDEFQLSRIFRHLAGHPPSALRQMQRGR